MLTSANNDAYTIVLEWLDQNVHLRYSSHTIMAKQPSTLRLNLPAPAKGVPLYRWLYEELRAAILAGRLPPGARLPATRDLAEQYGLSRPTIVSAFEQLRLEGYVEGKVGSGTYVSKTLPDTLLHAPQARAAKRARAKKPHFSEYARRLPVFVEAGFRPLRAFRARYPALDEFPTGLWAQVAARRLRRASVQLLSGGEALGYRPLRQAVAEYLNTSRGVKCAAEQVLIISGVQQALDRASRLLLNPGDPVWMEEPGYPGAARAFAAIGARICPVPVDSQGLNLEAGMRRWDRPRLVYVTPAHQFPLGMTMSLSRRLALLAWAQRSGAVIFEDDYDSEYRYAGRPIPALQGLDTAGVVIFAGSFSDVLFPGLRLAYIVVPPAMVDRFAAAESVSTHPSPLVDQAILSDFIREGHFARHVRRMRELYAERLEALLDCARKELAGVLTIPPIEAGLRTVAWLQPQMSAEKAALLAEKRQIDVLPLSRYAWGKSKPNGLVLGFAAVGTKEIRRGVQGLAEALTPG